MMAFARTFRRGDAVLLLGRPEGLAGRPPFRGTYRRLSMEAGRAVVDVDGLGDRSVAIDDLRHAPVQVRGPVQPPLPTTCPSCGAPLALEEAETYAPRRPTDPSRRRRVTVLACSGCEFVTEVRR